MSDPMVEQLDARRLMAVISPDPNFGRGGTLTPAGSTTSQLRVVAVTSSGILASNVGNYDRLERYGFDGFQDLTFDASTIPVSRSLTQYAKDAQGRFVYALASNRAGQVFVGRLRADGTADTAFGDGGMTTLIIPSPGGEGTIGADVDAVAVAADGSTYVAVGVSTKSDDGAAKFRRRYVYKFSAGGVRDAAFGRVAMSATRPDFFLAAAPDNGLFVGYRPQAGRYTLARYNSAGQPVRGFGRVGVYTLVLRQPATFTLALDAAGRPLIGTSGATASVVRLTTGGEFDRTFGEAGVAGGFSHAQSQAVTSLLPQADGKLIVQVVDRNRQVLLRLDADGEIDRTFDDDGVLDVRGADAASSVRAQLPDGSFLAATNYAGELGYDVQKLGQPTLAALQPGGRLSLIGDSGNDNFNVFLNASEGRVEVFANDRRFSFDRLRVKSIAAALGQGNNVFASSVHVRSTVVGGNGDDSITTGEKDDFIQSGNGVDTVRARSGRDTIYFGAGDKFIDSGSEGGQIYNTTGSFDGNVAINGGPTGDWDVQVSAATATVRLRGDTAKVTVNTTGGSRVDVSEIAVRSLIRARNGRDVIYGSRGPDLIYGGNGRDRINGGDGRDTIYGQAGNDILTGGADADLLDGGADMDLAVTDDDDLIVSIER